MHEAVEVAAFQPGERRNKLVAAEDRQVDGEAHAELMPTVCTHDPDQLPMKSSTGRKICPAVKAMDATKATNLRYIIDLLLIKGTLRCGARYVGLGLRCASECDLSDRYDQRLSATSSDSL